jgi:serine/threonine protein kinase
MMPSEYSKGKHSMTVFEERLLICLRYHQDIKPSNILVFDTSPDTPYKFTAKIADLGLSYFIQQEYYIPHASGKGQPGTRTYGLYSSCSYYTFFH